MGSRSGPNESLVSNQGVGIRIKERHQNEHIVDKLPRFQRSTIMAKGAVKWFNDAKGLGFITPEDGGRDLFVHFSAVEASGLKRLKEGDRVEFDAT